jgi:hypothetical protein
MDQELSLLPSSASSAPSPLVLPARISAGCCAAWLIVIFGMRAFDSNAPPVSKMLGIYAIVTLAPAFGLAGALSMLKRKHYRLSVMGAACLLVPLVGPWFGLTFPLGIWLLVLLRRRSIRDQFASADTFDRLPSLDAEDQMSAAAKLEASGDWDEAIAKYRDVAACWPEQTEYVENCIKNIAEKQRSANGR